MKFKVKNFDIEVKEYKVVMNVLDVNEMGLMAGDRVKVKNKESVTAVVDTTDTMLPSGVVGIYDEVWKKLRIKKGEQVEILPAAHLKSIALIKKKMDGNKLNKEEFHIIVQDIVDGNLTDAELTAFVTSTHIHGMDLDEIEWMTRAMVDTGERIEFDKHPVVDKHSIGGVPGNKVSLLVVPIVAAAGLLIPKTSSRAITGAAGTADLMEVLAPVSLSANEIKKITEKVGGVIAWGGATNIAPADDEIIEVEYPLSIDPYCQVLASVMAKKCAVGADAVVIDIPTGSGAKMHTIAEGRKMARDFIELGERMNMSVECVMTYGGGPIGRTIGPALEVQEALCVLESMKGPHSLIEKSTSLAGILLEMGGVAQGAGKAAAEEILRSGKALQKLKEIIEAQGGDSNISSKTIQLGDEKAEWLSPTDGYATEFDNQRLIEIARAAGAPADKEAGIVIHKKKGEAVEKGETLITIYAEKSWKLENAVKEARRGEPVIVEGMVLERVPDITETRIR
ncbi:MAG: AMP phosphorylase [Methanocellales archaeon]|nr:AMP phosphorylase [Methanocellales archaeon]